MTCIPQWERVPVVDVVDRLKELSRSGENRLFHPLDAGDYVFSIQASGKHCSVPAAPAPAGQVTAWEVAIFDASGRLLIETTAPELLSLPPEWTRYWSDGIGRFVPTDVIRVLLQRFSLGPEHFDRFVLEPD